MPIDQLERARRAWPVLVQMARRKSRGLSYKDLCDPLGLHWRAAHWFLGPIQEWCEQNNKPRLQALVINHRTRVPGAQYHGDRTLEGHQRELESVWAEKWP